MEARMSTMPTDSQVPGGFPGQLQKPAPSRANPPEDSQLVTLFDHIRTESGHTLLELLDEKPMLLIFLRYFGCPFCRETISDVAKAKSALDRRGVRPVFVHMADPAHAQKYFEHYGLGDVERVSDPQKKLYRAPEIHLLKAKAIPKYRGLKAMWNLVKRPLFRHGQGIPTKTEDHNQLPGVFFLKDRAIYRAYRHKTLYDRPDYARFGA